MNGKMTTMTFGSKNILLMLTFKRISDEEHVLFVMNSNNRKSLVRLGEYCLEVNRTKTSYSKKKAYKAAFETTYTEQFDYLLRNELRLLKQCLAGAWAQIQLTKPTGYNAQKDILFLRALLQNEHFEAFRAEWKKAVKRSEQHDAVQAQIELLHLFYDAEYIQATTKVEVFETMQSNSAQAELLIQQESQRLLMRNAMQRSFAEVNMALYKKDVVFTPLPSETKELTDVCAQFYSLKARSYQLKGQARQSCLQKAIKLLEYMRSTEINRSLELARLSSNLGLEYFFDKQYPQAVEQFRLALLHLKKTEPAHLFVQFNCLSAILKSGGIQEGLELINDNKKAFMGSLRMRESVRSLHIMALLYEGRLEEANALFTDSLKEGSNDNYYYQRLCLALLHFLRGKWELAMREANNLRQTIGKNPTFENYYKAAGWFNQYFGYVTDGVEQHQQKLKKLHSAIKDYSELRVKHTDILPLLWLKEKINQDITEKTL